MHPLLVQGSEEASRLYSEPGVVDAKMDWSKLRVSTLPKEMSSSDFLKVLKNGTKVVSVADFRTAFTKAVLAFKANLGQRKWFAVVDLVDQEANSTSRSLFFFLLALLVCPEISQNLEGVLRLPKRFALSYAFTNFVYVYFDDFVSSGCTIETTLKPVSSMPRFVVSAYVGEIAKEYLGNIGVNVVHSEVVLPFVKIDPSRSNIVDFKYEAHPILLSHRALSVMEGFPEIYDKVLAVRQGEHFPATDRYSRYEYLVRDIVDKFVC